MDANWQTLLDAGVPAGPLRRVLRVPQVGGRVRAALREVAGDPAGLDRTRAETLLAWLLGLRHHWPSRYREVLGPEADVLVERLSGLGLDDGRVTRLRRIAIANLAEVHFVQSTRDVPAPQSGSPEGDSEASR